MRETAKELATLQALIDSSFKRTGPHMKAIIHPGKYSLNAKQVVKLLDGMKTVAVAAPAPNGDPLVAPMDGWFLHGKFFFSSGGDSIRITGLRKRPREHRVLRGREVPHQRARARRTHVQEALLRRARSADAKQMSAARPREYGSSAFEWSDEGVYVRLDADRFFTYSRTPKEFPV